MNGLGVSMKADILLESQWLITMGYFKPIMAYPGVVVACYFQLLGCPGCSLVYTNKATNTRDWSVIDWDLSQGLQ